ncbi:MAG: methyltransferase domain-containing protein, partial [Pseudomonas sp.]
MTTTAHTQVVQKQFGEQASAYLSSAVHAQGTEFAVLQAELAGQGAARLLDLGCGAGHVSFHVAPLVKEVVAYDLSQQMLDVVAAAAVERDLD